MKIIVGIIGTSALLSLTVWLLLRGAESPVAATGPTEEAVVATVGTPDSVPVAERAAPSAEEKVLVLRTPVQTILSRESTYLARAQQIKELDRNLPTEDVAALRDFLLLPPSEVENLSPIALNSIKNDVLEVLMDQAEMPDGLGQQVVDMFNDPNADYMWREYCLQFMQPFYERVAAESMEHGAENGDQRAGVRGQKSVDDNQKDAELETIRETLFSALDERDEDLAATALLGLSRLAKRTEEFDHNEVIAQAIEIAEDPNASVRCRLTAMRVAAQAGNVEILPTARVLAMNGPTDLLRGAAIITLGDFADPQDRDFLETLAATGNQQLSAAAKVALAKMDNSR